MVVQMMMVMMKISSHPLSLGFWGHPGLASQVQVTKQWQEARVTGEARGNSDQPSSWPAAQSRLDKSNLNAARRALFLDETRSPLPELGMRIIFVFSILQFYNFANANAGHIEWVHINILQGYIPWISLNQTFLSTVKC